MTKCIPAKEERAKMRAARLRDVRDWILDKVSERHLEQLTSLSRLSDMDLSLLAAAIDAAGRDEESARREWVED